jgi:hypothetical protein
MRMINLEQSDSRDLLILWECHAFLSMIHETDTFQQTYEQQKVSFSGNNYRGNCLGAYMFSLRDNFFIVIFLIDKFRVIQTVFLSLIMVFCLWWYLSPMSWIRDNICRCRNSTYSTVFASWIMMDIKFATEFTTMCEFSTKCQWHTPYRIYT